MWNLAPEVAAACLASRWAFWVTEKSIRVWKSQGNWRKNLGILHLYEYESKSPQALFSSALHGVAICNMNLQGSYWISRIITVFWWVFSVKACAILMLWSFIDSKVNWISLSLSYALHRHFRAISAERQAPLFILKKKRVSKVSYCCWMPNLKTRSLSN